MSLPSTYTFRWGEGQISGFLSAALGLLGVLAVLCFRFPALLTFPDLHSAYDPEVMRLALGCALLVAMILGLVNFCIGRWRTLGCIGMGATFVAILLGGLGAGATSSFGLGVPIGLDWFILDLLASALLFIPLERLWVLRREQPVLRAEWRLDLQYFALVHLLVSLLIIISSGAVARLFSWSVNAPLQGFISGLPLWVQFPLILVVADLAQYWSHRLMHTVPALWRVHAVHHSSAAMDWLASSRLHLVEVLITRTCVLVPVFVLGFSQLAVLLYVVYIGLHAIFVHANVRFTFGPLRHLLVTPAYHHWHHSDEPAAANTNFAVHLPVIDRLFGTYHHPACWPASYGIGPERLPPGILRQFLYPLTGWWRARRGGERAG
ncbi:MAG: sterol desaturase family protein [Planctomycetes bacterium]|nr:sterol desaturase family protein [Planctomycetota bacterium]